MAIIPWNPALSRIWSRWPEEWEDDLAQFFPNSNNLDVYETENDVVVRANVAGVPKDGIDLTFEKGVLWIKAEKTEEKDDQSKKHYSKSSWSYSYKIAIPGMLDHTAEPEVQLEDGVVTVTFKKAEASKPKKLTIKAANKAA
ncbi:Hsp20/alpha crystallin family protein [Patescibacteria group bacterium]|nr:Hsp20/alpha crystallin family protein [Patescibacteria group bacterium]